MRVWTLARTARIGQLPRAAGETRKTVRAARAPSRHRLSYCIPPAQRHSETSLPVLSKSSYYADGRAFGRPRVSLAGNPAVDRVSRSVSLRLDEARVCANSAARDDSGSGPGHWWSKFSIATKRQWPAACRSYNPRAISKHVALPLLRPCRCPRRSARRSRSRGIAEACRCGRRSSARPQKQPPASRPADCCPRRDAVTRPGARSWLLLPQPRVHSTRPDR
jgi:hypothetical protein